MGQRDKNNDSCSKRTVSNGSKKAENIARKEHVPVLVHVTEMTQPQGHSTSGSHERYKSKYRLQWENDYDCIELFKKWWKQRPCVLE